jgi:hypothetical protein
MFGGAENIAGGEMTRAESFAEQFRLRSLAHTGRAEQHQTIKPCEFFVGRQADSVTAFNPGDSIIVIVHNPKVLAAWNVLIGTGTGSTRMSLANCALIASRALQTWQIKLVWLVNKRMI